MTMAIKIALDPGHGLKTPGKQTPDGIKEWTLNDKVRDKVVSILSEYKCEILHTDNNEGGTDESLGSRVTKYTNAGAKSCISLHHNAYKGDWCDVTGVEVYVDKNATPEDLKLAELIYDRLVKYTGLKGRGIKRANFQVINQNRVPAVLVEGGFMDSKKDYKVITSEDGQTAYAKAVAEALIEFHGLKKKTAKTTTTTKKPATSKTTKIKEWQNAAIKDGYKFPKYGADGKWGSESENVAKKAICKKQLIGYKNKNLTKIVQKSVGATADGKFGTNTKNAVIKWQKLMGLKADGIVGLNTWKKLLGV